MAKKSTIAAGRAKDKKTDEQLLVRLKAAIDETPVIAPLATVLVETATSAMAADRIRRATAARTALLKRIRPDIEGLAVLRARWLPDALLPPACRVGHHSSEPDDPVVNFATCLDLCAPCRDEALRELKKINDAIRRERPGVFLPASVVQMRLNFAIERTQQQNDLRAESKRSGQAWVTELLKRRAAHGTVVASDLADAGPVKSTNVAAPNPSLRGHPSPKPSSGSSGLWARFVGRSATKESFLRLVRLLPRNFRDKESEKKKKTWARQVTDKVCPTHRPRGKGPPSYYRVEDLRRTFESTLWPNTEPLLANDVVDRWTIASDGEIDGYDLVSRN